MLAPQAYLKITSVGITDPMGYVISVIMIAAAPSARMALGALCLRGRDFATLQRGGGGLSRRALGPAGSAIAAAFVCAGPVCSCSRRISAFSCFRSRRSGRSRVLPDGFTLAHYGTVFREAVPLIANTLLYCGLGRLDRRRARRRARLYRAAHAAARPSAGRAGRDGGGRGARAGARHRTVAHLSTTCKLPFTGEPLATFWFMLVIAYAVRRLPYALSAADRRAAADCMSASRRPPRTSVPANSRTLARIVVPLMTGGLLAGFVTSFATAAVELSATLMLVAHDGRRAARLRHLRLHAVGRRARARRRARRDRGGGRRRSRPTSPTASPSASAP